MKLIVNGQPQVLEHALTIAELLDKFGYGKSLVAVAVNQVCVLRQEFLTTTLRPDDEIEILAPMAGG